MIEQVAVEDIFTSTREALVVSVNVVGVLCGAPIAAKAAAPAHRNS
jgi:hypothetical protein